VRGARRRRIRIEVAFRHMLALGVDVHAKVFMRMAQHDRNRAEILFVLNRDANSGMARQQAAHGENVAWSARPGRPRHDEFARVRDMFSRRWPKTAPWRSRNS